MLLKKTWRYWIVLVSVLVPTACGQYAIGEPMAEPEPYLNDDATSGALDIFDVMYKGGFVQSAAEIMNFSSLANMTCTNVSYPIQGAGTEYLVDVKTVRAPPSGAELLKVSNRAKLSINISAALLNDTELIAMSEFHSTKTQMFGTLAVSHHVHGNASSRDEWSHFIPGNVGGISVHAVSLLPNNASTASDRVSLRPLTEPMNFSLCLIGQYASVFQSVTSLPGRLTKWHWDCARWEKPGRRWNTQGCFVTDDPDNNTLKMCSCDDKSNSSTYTLLLSVETQSTVPSLVLAMCIIFESVSIISLLIALITLLCLRRALKASTEESSKSRGDTANHINLCAALVLLHLSVLLRPLGILNTTSCELIAVLTHYFLLVSGAWMLAEGIYLYRRTCSNAVFAQTSTSWASFCVTYIVLPWVCPAILVGVCFGVYLPSGGYMDHSMEYSFMMMLRRVTEPEQSELDLTPEYPKYTICWLNPTMTYAAAVPIAIMLFPNIVISILVSTRVWKIKRQDGTRRGLTKSQRSEGRNNSVRKRPLQAVSSTMSTTNTIRSKPVVASFRAFLILLPVLGVPWIGTFVGVVPGAESYITALHLLASSLQGLLVACVVCLVNRDVRKAILRKLRSKCRCFAGAKVSSAPPPV